MDAHAELDIFKNVSSSDKNRWQEICKLWQESGKSVNVFCAERGLNKHTLTYWRGKFIREEKQTKSASFVPVKIKKNNSLALMPLSIPSHLSIKIQTPQGYVISIPTEDMACISKVLHLLGVTYA
jgi:hypothetical protein